MSMRAYLVSVPLGDPQGIWPSSEWQVQDSERKLYGATWPLAKGRCRLWGLLHGYGWLKPKS